MVEIGYGPPAREYDLPSIVSSTASQFEKFHKPFGSRRKNQSSFCLFVIMLLYEQVSGLSRMTLGFNTHYCGSPFCPIYGFELLKQDLDSILDMESALFS